MAANLTETARIAIDQLSVLPEVTMGLGLAPSNQVCAHLMIRSTINTNAVVTRINLIGMNIKQVIAKILNIPIHVHNIKAGLHTEGHKPAIMTVTVDSLAVMIVIKDKLATTTATVDSPAVMIVIKDKPATITATVDSLAVMIVINGHLVMLLVLIHIIHAGRAVRLDNMTTMQENPLNLSDTVAVESRSYSKATTSTLTQTTLPNHALVKTELIWTHRSR